MYTIIHLEDNGQDFLRLITDNSGKVIKAEPFQTEFWKGAFIPINHSEMFHTGANCPIHHPPNIEFGFLKHKIEKIEQVNEINSQTTTTNS